MSDVYEEVYDAVRDYEQMYEDGAPVDDIVKELCGVGTRPEQLVRDAIDRMEEQGEIYSPDGGDHFRITNRQGGA